MRLLRSQEELASVASIGMRPDLVFVSFPTRISPTPVWDGQELRGGEIVLHGLGALVHRRTAGANEKGVIALTPEHLEFWSQTLAEAKLALPDFAQIVEPPPSSTARLLRLHREACALAEVSPEIMTHPEVKRSLEQQLIHALVTCLMPDAPLQIRPISARRSVVMKRLEDALAAHPDRPLHVPELCAAIGVSERTLRVYCAEFLGMSASRYLGLRRLRLARAALRNPDSENTTVASVARRYGFTELGRFAHFYRAVYGEAPSTTLRLRSHQSPPD